MNPQIHTCSTKAITKLHSRSVPLPTVLQHGPKQQKSKTVPPTQLFPKSEAAVLVFMSCGKHVVIRRSQAHRNVNHMSPLCLQTSSRTVHAFKQMHSGST